MYVSRRAALGLLAASAFAGSAATSVAALGDEGNRHGPQGENGNRTLLRTSLAPSVTTDPNLLKATAGGVPWMLRSGQARLQADGALEVRIRGLLIPIGMFAGTTGPVKTVSASLYCADNSTAVGTSDSFPLSSGGDARIVANFTLPAKCQIPALLIHPNGANGTYIATSGFGG